jgi:hypothetical protein
MRHSGHKVGERGVEEIEVTELGVVVRRSELRPIWVPHANVRWGELMPTEPVRLDDVLYAQQPLKAAGGQRGRRK